MPSARPWWRDINIVFPLCLMVVTTIYLAATFTISTAFDTSFVNSAFTPRVVAVIMYLALLVVLRDAVRQRARAEGEEKEPASWAQPLWVVLLTCVYIAVFRSLGYVLSTLPYVYALFHVFRFEEKSWLKRAIYAAAITAVFYVLFAELFGVRLPKAWGVI